MSKAENPKARINDNPHFIDYIFCMKYFAVFSILAVFPLVSCASHKVEKAQIEDGSFEFEENQTVAQTPQYSSRTVIVSLDSSATDKDVDDLAAEFNLNVIYRMNMLNMCALSGERDFSPAELDALIEEISKKPFVVGAMKDEIVHLDGAN